MAFVHGKAATIYSGGYDATAYLTDASRTMTRDAVDVTTLGATGDSKVYIPGLTDATLSLNGFYDPAAQAGDQLWFDHLAAAGDVVTTYYPEGDTIGNLAIVHPNTQTTYTIDSSVGGATGFTVNQQGSTAASGVSLHALSQETGVGDYTSVDDTGTAGSTSQGGVASLHISEATGMSALTVIIQDSTDDAVWADLITFTDFAVGGFTANVIGNVDRYVRARVTVFTGTSATFAVSFARF